MMVWQILLSKIVLTRIGPDQLFTNFSLGNSFHDNQSQIYAKEPE